MLFDTQQDERQAVKAGVQLALSRYRDSYGRFVQGKRERLEFISDQLTLLSRECAGATEADPAEVEKQLRIILADEVAVSEPERRDVTQQIGDETEGKDYEGRPDMPGVAEMDIKATQPVLIEELTDADAKVDLNEDTDKDGSGLSSSSSTKEACERCSTHEQQDGSIFCTGCNQFVLGESEEDPLEKEAQGMPPNPTTGMTCPSCGSGMNSDPNAMGHYICPNCGVSMQVSAPTQQPAQIQPAPGFQQGMPTGLGGGLYASLEKILEAVPEEHREAVAKRAKEIYADQGFELDENAQSPAEGDAELEQSGLPPAVEQTGNETADLYSSVVEEMANSQAAIAWSTAGDQDVIDIAEAYNLDPDTVRSSLKIVADFGDSVAVNGDLDGDPSTEGLVELDQFGGRIPTTEEEVDVDSAIQATADRTSISSEDAYTLVEDAYGADLGGQQYVSVGGDARFYLPAELVQKPGQDVDSPDESMEEAVESSAQTPPRFRSLQQFLEWDRNRTVSV